MIDNTVKCSPENKNIIIKITDISSNEIRVVSESIGSYSKPEKQKIVFFDRGDEVLMLKRGWWLQNRIVFQENMEMHNTNISVWSAGEGVFRIGKWQFDADAD